MFFLQLAQIREEAERVTEENQQLSNQLEEANREITRLIRQADVSHQQTLSLSATVGEMRKFFCDRYSAIKGSFMGLNSGMEKYFNVVATPDDSGRDSVRFGEVDTHDFRAPSSSGFRMGSSAGFRVPAVGYHVEEPQSRQERRRNTFRDGSSVPIGDRR